MLSPNRPAPDLNARVLGATLASVRERRTEKRRSTNAVASVILAAALGSWWITRPDVVPTKMAIADTLPPSPPTAESITVERIPQAPPKITGRISAARPSSAIKRIPEASSTRGRIPTLTDDQLLAEIPAGQTAALIRDPGGSTQLIVFH